MNYGLRAVSIEKITSSGSTTASSAIADNIEYVRLVSSADCHIAFAASPTATSSTHFLPAKEVEVWKISAGEKIAVIGSCDLYITSLTE